MRSLKLRCEFESAEFVYIDEDGGERFFFRKSEVDLMFDFEDMSTLE